MQISLRSHLIAGTAAVVGASAIALTPVIAQHEALPNIQLPSASAAVALAGFDSPVSELLKTLGVVNGDLFSQPLGVLPIFVNNPAPLLRQLATNQFSYIQTSINAGLQAGFDLSEGVWNAAGDLANLDPIGALNTILASVQAAGTVIADGASYVLNNVLAKTQALISFATTVALPGLLPTLTNQIKYLVGATTNVIKQITTELGAGNWENAWNATIDGFFGPKAFGGVAPSIPGAILDMTIGNGGVLPGPIAVPSLKLEIVGLQTGVKAALQVAAPNPPVPPPTAAKSVAASVAAKRSAAPSVAAVSSGAEDNGGASVGGGDNGGSKSAGKSSSNSGNSDRGSSKASKH